MNLDLIIFVFSAVVAIFGAAMMIAQRNPVASVLYLILSLVAQAAIYVQLGALFVGVMLVIVYAGAIMVLFLFVIMLLNLRGGEDLGQPSGIVSRFSKYLITGLLFVELAFVIRGVFEQSGTTAVAATASDFGSVRAVWLKLFTKYLYPFELTGVLLLIAVVGAVVIARKERSDDALEEIEAPELTQTQSDQAVKS
jgi:NADH-quinone oxidoreductase subunit J